MSLIELAGSILVSGYIRVRRYSHFIASLVCLMMLGMPTQAEDDRLEEIGNTSSGGVHKSAEEPDYRVKLSELGFIDGITLEGNRADKSFYVPVPFNDVTKEGIGSSQIELPIFFSPVLDRYSTVSVYVNDQPVGVVSSGKGNQQHAKIDVPANLFGERYLKVTLRADLAMDRTRCFDNDAASVWAHILPEAAFNSKAAVNYHSVGNMWALYQKGVDIILYRASADDLRHAIILASQMIERGVKPELHIVSQDEVEQMGGAALLDWIAINGISAPLHVNPPRHVIEELYDKPGYEKQTYVARLKQKKIETLVESSGAYPDFDGFALIVGNTLSESFEDYGAIFRGLKSVGFGVEQPTDVSDRDEISLSEIYKGEFVHKDVVQARSDFRIQAKYIPVNQRLKGLELRVNSSRLDSGESILHEVFVNGEFVHSMQDRHGGKQKIRVDVPEHLAKGNVDITLLSRYAGYEPACEIERRFTTELMTHSRIFFDSGSHYSGEDLSAWVVQKNDKIVVNLSGLASLDPKSLLLVANILANADIPLSSLQISIGAGGVGKQRVIHVGHSSPTESEVMALLPDESGSLTLRNNSLDYNLVLQRPIRHSVVQITDKQGSLWVMPGHLFPEERVYFGSGNIAFLDKSRAALTFDTKEKNTVEFSDEPREGDSWIQINRTWIFVGLWILLLILFIVHSFRRR